MRPRASGRPLSRADCAECRSSTGRARLPTWLRAGMSQGAISSSTRHTGDQMEERATERYSHALDRSATRPYPDGCATANRDRCREDRFDRMKDSAP